MKRALACGAGGFIGVHLVKKLRGLGYRVRGVDIKRHKWPPDGADESTLLDLRIEDNCRQALTVNGGIFDEVYQLAADLGGMGFIHSAETEIVHHSALINIYMTDQAARLGVLCRGGRRRPQGLTGVTLPCRSGTRAETAQCFL